MVNKRKAFNSKKLSEGKIAVSVRRKKNNTIAPQVLSKLKTLKKLLKQHENQCWQIGDLCIELIDEHKLSLRQIGEFTDYSRTRISHFHLTARTFPNNYRKGYTFQDSLTARQIYHKLPRLNMTPDEIRNVIVKMRDKTPTQVRGYFIKILIPISTT